MSGEGTIPGRPAKAHGTRWRRGSVICPICNANARFEGSDPVTELVKTFWFACTNVDCGMTWRAQLAFEYVISPSAIQRPDISLPQAPPDLVRKTFPAGAAGKMPEPDHDPNQMTMFGEDPDEDSPERQDAA